MKSSVTARWERTILICAKCSKRLEGGFGKKGKQGLAKVLRRYLGLKRWRKAPIGIVETKCLGVCPKGGVTVVDAAEPGKWRIVSRGTDPADIAAALGLVPQT